SNRALEFLASATIVQGDLRTIGGEFQLFGHFIGIGQLQNGMNLFFVGPIEHGSSYWQTFTQVLCQFHELIVTYRLNVSLFRSAVIGLVDKSAQFFELYLALGCQQFADTLADPSRRPAQMDFEYLPNVHS